MQYIGLDVHKNNTSACVLNASGKVVRELDVRSSQSGLQIIHNSMKDDTYAVMLESSTYSYVVYRFFELMGIEAHMVHAKSLKVVTESDKKTDKRDAQTIGRYLRLWKLNEIELSMSYVPSVKETELKDVCRYREEISNKMGDETRRIKSHIKRNCYELSGEYDNLQTMKTRAFIESSWPDDVVLMRRIHNYSKLLAESKEMKMEIESRMKGDHSVDLLSDIPGIGRQTAVEIMSMIVDIDRFEDPEKLCSYFGMVPRVKDSGGKTIHGRMTKNGDKMMRSVMERVTLSHVQNCESSITAFYKRKVGEMGVKKALITASKKMLAVIFAVLKRGTRFTA